MDSSIRGAEIPSQLTLEGGTGGERPIGQTNKPHATN